MDRKVRHVKRSQQQERRGVSVLGGTLTGGSGNGWARKNDQRTLRWSVEYKRTDAQQITVKAKDLQTAEKHALLDGRNVLFGVEVGGRDYVILTREDFETLLAEGETSGPVVED
jgi:hypothetical protein